MLLNKLVTNICRHVCISRGYRAIFRVLDLFMKVKYAQMPRREEIHKFLYNSPKSLDVLNNG